MELGVIYCMESFNEKEFKISGQNVNKKEREFLKYWGFRWCAKCQSAKAESEFYLTQHACIPCIKIKKDEWLNKNPLYFKTYRENHKEQQSKAHRNWFLNNQEKKNQQNKDWYYLNKDKKRITNNEWRKNQSVLNPIFRMSKALRQRIRGAIIKGHKSQKTLDLLGCSLSEFVSHLESQFTEGMSWSNYGNPNGNHSNCWHIDHIKPCSLFDLTQEEEQRLCFHYSNMQPLWGIENIKKGSKYN
jgi:hypothetical protein